MKNEKIITAKEIGNYIRERIKEAEKELQDSKNELKYFEELHEDFLKGE